MKTTDDSTASEGSLGCRVGPRATVVLMFQPRFAPKVEDGSKTRTIRPPRKRPVKVGDPVSLRQWTGKPYASKQRVLRQGIVSRVAEVYLGNYGTSVDGVMLTTRQETRFAQDDGFAGMDTMRSWFAETHGLPFSGTMIEWANK